MPVELGPAARCLKGDLAEGPPGVWLPATIAARRTNGHFQAPIASKRRLKCRFAVDALAAQFMIKGTTVPCSDVAGGQVKPGSRQGWSCRNRMVPVWKGGGSAYVISYQPEVDCLTAVDGLQVDSP